MTLTKIFTFVLVICALATQAHTAEKTNNLAEANSGNEAIANATMMKTMDSSKVQLPGEYKFDQRFVILIENFDKKGKPGESNEMTFLSRKESSAMGILMNQEGINTSIIYDLDNYEMITLMNVSGQKMGTTVSIDKSQAEGIMSAGDSEEADMTEMPTFKKTGETKTISGYSCDEYIVENLENSDGTKMVYWITEEAEIEWIESMSNMSSINKQMPNLYTGTGYPEDGSIIQMIVEEKNGERMVMTLKEAETNKEIIISTKGYTFMNMGGR
ncbi:MAG: hypothetical protein ACJAY4_001956 [Cryomorphaceae bacterium]|jgi:hypothetical protein